MKYLSPARRIFSCRIFYGFFMRFAYFYSLITVFYKRHQAAFKWFIMGVWIAGSLMLLSLRIPHIDEAHAYNIAAHTNLLDWIILPKYEGHFFLWFSCLKLVQYLSIPYPWDMFFLNWVVMGTVIYLLVWKSPFRTVTKALLVWSYALLVFYSVFARCYSILILCLLLTCILYPKRIKRPYLFFICLFFLSQTCFLGTIAAVAFGLIWAFDLLRACYKKQVRWRTFGLCAAFSILTGVLLWVELYNYRVPVYDLEAHLTELQFLRFWARGEILCFTLFGVLLYKNLRVMIWYIMVLVSMLLVHYYVYSLEEWHFVFVYVFSVCALWLFDGKKYKKISLVLICLLTVCSCLDYQHREGIFYFFKFPWYRRIVQENADLLKHSTVFITTLHLSPVVPWLEKLHVTSYSMETGLKLYSMDNLKLFHQMHSGWDVQIPYSKIKERIDPSKPAVILGQRAEIPRAVYWGFDDRRFTFELLECVPGGRPNMQPCIYRIIPDPDDNLKHSYKKSQREYVISKEAWYQSHKGMAVEEWVN